MYNDIILLLKDKIEEANEKQKIRIKPLSTILIDNNIYLLLKTELDDTAWILRAIDKDEKMMALLKSRGEFMSIFLNVNMWLETAYDAISINETGDIMIDTNILESLMKLSYAMNQLCGLANGNNDDIDYKIKQLRDIKSSVQTQNLNINNKNNIYTIDPSDDL
jgi:hypothetical protein